MKKYTLKEIDLMRKLIFRIERESYPQSDSYPDYPAEYNWTKECEEKLRTYMLGNVSVKELSDKVLEIKKQELKAQEEFNKKMKLC